MSRPTRRSIDGQADEQGARLAANRLDDGHDGLSDAEVIALARIEAAGHFRRGAPPIDPTIAKLASGHMRALPYAMVRSLIERGLAIAGAGIRITDDGRSALAAAINAHARAPRRPDPRGTR